MSCLFDYLCPFSFVPCPVFSLLSIVLLLMLCYSLSVDACDYEIIAVLLLRIAVLGFPSSVSLD